MQVAHCVHTHKIFEWRILLRLLGVLPSFTTENGEIRPVVLILIEDTAGDNKSKKKMHLVVLPYRSRDGTDEW